jgi:hypothetical protein
MPATILYFGVKLDGETPQLAFYDGATTTTTQILIPSGTYFYCSSAAAVDIVAVLNALLGALCTVSRENNRQLKFAHAHANSTLLLNNCTDFDKLSDMLGWYTNAGVNDGLTEHIHDDGITQCTLSAWYTTSGKTYETADMYGFPTFDAVHYQTQAGVVTAISGTRHMVSGDLTFTGIDHDAVRSAWDNGTQGTRWVSTSATWTPSFWRAYNPALHEAEMYMDCYDGDTEHITGHFYLVKPVLPENCRPLVAGWRGIFNITLQVCYHG